MSGRRYYSSQPYSRLDEDPTTWSSEVTADAIPEPYDPTHSTANTGTADTMPLEPYPHFQAEYGNNPLNNYSAQLPAYPGSARPSPTRNSPSRDSKQSRRTSYHGRALSYDSERQQPEHNYSRPTSYQPVYTNDAPPTSYQPEHTNNIPTNTYQPQYPNTTRSAAYAMSENDDFESLKQRSRPRPAKSPRTYPWTHWSKKRKWIIFGGSAAALIILIIIIGVAVAVSNKSYSYTASPKSVTNPEAFTFGGATHSNPNNTQDGIGAGVDEYTYYQGDSSNFPPYTSWVSFEDMWNSNLPMLQTSCSTLDAGADNTDTINNYIYSAIQTIANASLVDHRFILATILQESNGCVRVGHTTSSGGVTNPGLMQSHNGHSFDGSFPQLSILQMVQDGTQGTDHGAGLVQNLNVYGDPYKAARGYNSGYIPKNGDLSLAAGATACYVSDIANRLTGWTTVDSKCPGDTA